MVFIAVQDQLLVTTTVINGFSLHIVESKYFGSFTEIFTDCGELFSAELR